MKYFTRMFVFIAMPLGLIWALNTLFGTAIPYNWSTWLAMLILIIMAAVFLFPIYRARKGSNGRSDRTSL